MLISQQQVTKEGSVVFCFSHVKDQKTHNLLFQLLFQAFDGFPAGVKLTLEVAHLSLETVNSSREGTISAFLPKTCTMFLFAMYL